MFTCEVVTIETNFEGVGISNIFFNIDTGHIFALKILSLNKVIINENIKINLYTIIVNKLYSTLKFVYF